MNTIKYTPEQYITAVGHSCEIPHAKYDECRWCGIPIEHWTHKPIKPHTNWCFVTIVIGALKFAIKRGYFTQLSCSCVSDGLLKLWVEKGYKFCRYCGRQLKR